MKPHRVPFKHLRLLTGWLALPECHTRNDVKHNLMEVLPWDYKVFEDIDAFYKVHGLEALLNQLNIQFEDDDDN